MLDDVDSYSERQLANCLLSFPFYFGFVLLKYSLCSFEGLRARLRQPHELKLIRSLALCQCTTCHGFPKEIDDLLAHQRAVKAVLRIFGIVLLFNYQCSTLFAALASSYDRISYLVVSVKHFFLFF